MKTRFNTFDIICGITELQKLVGLRVNQIYDIDNKTYLIRLQGSNEKSILLIESGIRFHTTSFEWPKNAAPSGFSMKLRKHLRNKRLESVKQIGEDRIVDFQFGAGEVAYHVILELYDRGNIILTDDNYTISYILRPHTDGEEVRFAIHEKYELSRANKEKTIPNIDELKLLIENSANGETTRQFLMKIVSCVPALIDHVLKKFEVDNCILKSHSLENAIVEDEADKTNKAFQKKKKKNFGNLPHREFNIEVDTKMLMNAIQEINLLMNEGKSSVSKGYIYQKKEKKPSLNGEEDHFYQNIEYHPYSFDQFQHMSVKSFETFLSAVDEFYSSLQSQKIDMKVLQQEGDALKKLANVKNDHIKRLEQLDKAQQFDKIKADLIINNRDLVDSAIVSIRSIVANQVPWSEIKKMVKNFQENQDTVALCIKQLKLESNQITMQLTDPFENDSDSDENIEESKSLGPMDIDIDLSLSASANARKYYDHKRMAAQKEKKTIDASEKALKSAHRKTQETLKEVRTISNIFKARKVYWFEKFYWFISSENYLVIGGRDAQQNELIVKRYMRQSDIYVHAEIQGASSVIIRNCSDAPVPPKTLLEAGTMAISYSVAWDAKVVTNAYWVHSDQVSKTAPSGEYLGTGSFMIRGKKNFLPPCHLIMGLSLLFKLEDSFIESHIGERRVRIFDEDIIEQRINQQEVIVRQLTEVSLVSEKKEPETDLSDDEIELTSQFPDTEVKVNHDTGLVSVHRDSESKMEVKSKVVFKTPSDNEETTIIAAIQPKKKTQINAKKRKELKSLQSKVEEIKKINNPSAPSKRGQKGKLKKLKGKYKDQDEEERELRMQLLKPAKELPAKIETPTDDAELSYPKKNYSSKPPKQETELNEDIDEMPIGVDLDIVNSLTGQPNENDEILFVIPVVAPYQALQNYKFKVKLTPGTGKRGKAANSALFMFHKDKTCTSREKDLVKSVKDELVARNIPGKVKLSAPQLQKLRK